MHRYTPNPVDYVDPLGLVSCTIAGFLPSAALAVSLGSAPLIEIVPHLHELNMETPEILQSETVKRAHPFPPGEKQNLNPFYIIKKEFPRWFWEEATLDQKTRNAYNDMGIAATAGSATPCSVACGAVSVLIDGRLVLDSIAQSKAREGAAQVFPIIVDAAVSKIAKASGVLAETGKKLGIGSAVWTQLTIKEDYQE